MFLPCPPRQRLRTSLIKHKGCYLLRSKIDALRLVSSTRRMYYTSRPDMPCLGHKRGRGARRTTTTVARSYMRTGQRNSKKSSHCFPPSGLHRPGVASAPVRLLLTILKARRAHRPRPLPRHRPRPLPRRRPRRPDCTPQRLSPLASVSAAPLSFGKPLLERSPPHRSTRPRRHRHRALALALDEMEVDASLGSSRARQKRRRRLKHTGRR